MINAQIQTTLTHLYNDSKRDKLKLTKGLAMNLCRQLQPLDLKDVYLSITREQGIYLKQLIIDNNLKNLVEFGTSFGISTLFLAEAALKTKGKIITTELIQSKAEKAIENFKKAGVNNLIEVKIGNALETLNNYNEPIDFLLLDGWKDLYLPLFLLLKPNFHDKTVIYVDNADMVEVQDFLKTIGSLKKYQLRTIHNEKAAIITLV